MTERGEWAPWLRDAETALADARRNARDGAWRAACVMAQLAIEMSAKAVIARFGEPRWSHDPGDQVKAVVLARGDVELEAALGEGCREPLERLARDAHEAAVWHGQATYGKKLEGGLRVAAVDLCTEDVARDLVARADHAVAAALRLRR